MPTVLSSGQASNDYTPHPAGSFMAVCADVFIKTQPNKYKGQRNDKGKIDERETVDKVCIAFLTEEPIEIDGELKPRYAGFWASASMGTVDYPSNARKFLKGWWPTLTDAQIDEGFDLDKLIGKGAYLTIAHAVKDGKTYANIVGTAQPPKGATVPQIPADFKRHQEKEAAKVGTMTNDGLGEQDGDPF